MFGLRSADASELVALSFRDEATFAIAARIAAARKIPVDAPGRNTLIVRQSDEGIFLESADLLPITKSPMLNPEKIPSKMLARLRQALLR